MKKISEHRNDHTAMIAENVNIHGIGTHCIEQAGDVYSALRKQSNGRPRMLSYHTHHER